MRCVEAERNWDVEKNFFNFPVGDPMLRPVLSNVAIIPIASLPLGRVEPGHEYSYIAGVYGWSRRRDAAICHPERESRDLGGLWGAEHAFLMPSFKTRSLDYARDDGGFGVL
jgi:hypothetical protein